jgi:O-antigen/teichoic acid export membrane protein
MMTAMALKGWLQAATPRFLKPYWDRLEASPLGSRLARGYFWSFIGSFFSRIIGLIVAMFVARIIGKVGFGEFGMVQSTVGLFGAFAGLGMGLTATKFVAQYRTSDPIRAAAVLSLSSRVAWGSGCLMTAAVFFLAPWLAVHTLAAPHMTSYLRFGSLLLLLGSVAGAQSGALAGFEAFRSIARVNLVTGLSYLPLMIGGAWVRGVEGVVIGFTAATGVSAVLNYIELRKHRLLHRLPQRDESAQIDYSLIWKFALPGVLSNVILGSVNWACGALLVNQPEGYAQMGIFNAANNWFNAMVFLPGVLAQVLLPILSSQSNGAGETSSQRVVRLAMKANLLFVVPLVIGLGLASPSIMSLYGPGFRNGWPTLIAVVVSAGVFVVQVPPVQALTAAGRMWLVFVTYITWGLSYITLTALLLHGGAFGMASARLIAYVLNGVWVFWFAARYVWQRAGP